MSRKLTMITLALTFFCALASTGCSRAFRDGLTNGVTNGLAGGISGVIGNLIAGFTGG